MPILKHAKKKLRADVRKTLVNKATATRAKKAIDAFLKEKNETNLQAAFSAIDKAGKKRVFHPAKSDRLKSRLAKKIGAKTK